MHTPPLYRADFTGMRVRITERQGNPCLQPELQHHFHARHKLVQLTTTPENKHIAPGYWHLRLVTVKGSWNPIAHKQFSDEHAMIVGIDEVIVDITYDIDIIRGLPADIVGIKMKSLEDGFEYIAQIRINHGMKPIFPMKNRIASAAP